MKNLTGQDWLRIIVSYILLFVLCCAIGYTLGIIPILIVFIPFAAFLTAVVVLSARNYKEE